MGQMDILRWTSAWELLIRCSTTFVYIFAKIQIQPTGIIFMWWEDGGWLVLVFITPEASMMGWHIFPSNWRGKCIICTNHVDCHVWMCISTWKINAQCCTYEAIWAREYQAWLLICSINPSIPSSHWWSKLCLHGQANNIHWVFAHSSLITYYGFRLIAHLGFHQCWCFPHDLPICSLQEVLDASRADPPDER